jgi:hypothetical protein
VLGADYGYRLLWVLAISTAALIIFHEVAVRMGVVTGKGLMALVRERHGTRAYWRSRDRRRHTQWRHDRAALADTRPREAAAKRRAPSMSSLSRVLVQPGYVGSVTP